MYLTLFFIVRWVWTNLTNSTRYKMPRVIGKVEGRGNGIKTVIFNVTDLSLALKRDPGEVCKFFGTELGAQVMNKKFARKTIELGWKAHVERQEICAKVELRVPLNFCFRRQ